MILVVTISLAPYLRRRPAPPSHKMLDYIHIKTVRILDEFARHFITCRSSQKGLLSATLKQLQKLLQYDEIPNYGNHHVHLERRILNTAGSVCIVSGLCSRGPLLAVGTVPNSIFASKDPVPRTARTILPFAKWLESSICQHIL